MPAAGVRISELNQTYNVASDPTIYACSVFPAKRGIVGGYNSANTPEDFIKKSTPDEWIEVGFNVGYYDALQILQNTSNYGFIRAANNPKYGSASLVHLYDPTYTDQSANFSGVSGFSDPVDYDLSTISGREKLDPEVVTKVNTTTFSTSDNFFNVSLDGDSVSLWNTDTMSSDNAEPLCTGSLVKDNTSNKIQVMITSGSTTAAYSVDSEVTSITIVNNSCSDIPTAKYDRAVLIYDSTPGDFNVSIKVYPYRYTETLTNGSFSSNELVTSQDWSSGEAVRFTSTGTLPNGIEQYVPYYLKKDVTTGNYKLLTVSDDESTAVTISSTGTGTMRLVPIYNKCTQKGCFTIEVFTKKSRNVAVESFTVSRDPSLKDESGNTTYIVDVLEQSMYIRAIDNTAMDHTLLPMAQIDHLYLRGGSFGGVVSDSHMVMAAQALRNSTEVPVTLISDAGWTTPGYQNELINICEYRRDCLPIFSVPYKTTVSANALMDTVDYRNGFTSAEGGIASTRYGAVYTPWLKVIDPYNDRTVDIPPAGMVVGLICKNAANSRMWYVPAGYKRGIVKARGLTHSWGYTLQGDGDIATLIDNQINPIIKDSEGNLVVWGNETLMTESNDMSALNNSLVMIVIQPAIINLLRRYTTFEYLTEDTLREVQNIISNYLNNIKAGLGVQDFMVICDSSNNSEASIAQNRLIVDVAHIPMNYVKYVHYRHTITRNLDATTIVSSAGSSI